MGEVDEKNQVIIYKTEDGLTQVEVKMTGETVWLSQKQMAGIFEVGVPTINEHIKNIFSTHELEEYSVIRNFRITAKDGKEYNTKHYNLDVIIEKISPTAWPRAHGSCSEGSRACPGVNTIYFLSAIG